MEPQMRSWNDDRLDELSRRTDRRFHEVKQDIRDLRRHIDKIFLEVKEEFKEVRKEIEAVSG
jgi:hypothetical protein